MESEVGSRQGGQCGLGERQVLPDIAVRGVSGGVARNEQIVAVVAAKQKNADERLVVAGGLRPRTHQARLAKRSCSAQGGNGTAAEPEKIAPRFQLVKYHRDVLWCFRFYCCTWYCGAAAAAYNALRTFAEALVDPFAAASSMDLILGDISPRYSAWLMASTKRFGSAVTKSWRLLKSTRTLPETPLVTVRHAKLARASDVAAFNPWNSGAGVPETR